MTIPTEPIGSIPRPQKLISAFARYDQGSLSQDEFESICLEAVRDTIEKFEATGSPVITDGEQTKPSFATYPIHALSNLSPGGVKIQFADGHVRQLPKLLAGPFRYKTYASTYMQLASETDRRRVLRIVRENLPPSRRVFIGVIDPINPRVETPQEVRDRVFEASEFISPEFLGTTDDCGFSPFGDDVSTARKIAFAKIRSRVEGTLLAAEQLN